ncbi:RecBCD enzyme subunit RecC [Nymphon striatum]|nr:RecBCD enzyme subunit RecC [Nymphon striatum]
MHAIQQCVRLEVLHDRILYELDHDHTLAPSDFVVMMPDVEKYAPYIEAVFSESNPVLPFSIADREALNIFQIIEALEKLFKLADTRFDVESVFELLNYTDISDNFGLDQNQINKCRELAQATNIRWGISAQQRKLNALPNTEEHTWKYALDRILLEYCSLIKNEEISSQAFIEQPLSEPDASYKNVHLNDLILFYKNPARYFLKHRFSIQTFDDDPSLEIREPFELESFKDKEVRNLILDTLSLETKRSTDPTLVARAKVRLPMYKKPTFANTKEAQDRWQGNDRYAGEKDSFENWLLHRNLAMDKNNLPKEFIGN